MVKKERSNEFALFAVKTKAWSMKKVIVGLVLLSSLSSFGAQIFHAKEGLLVIERLSGVRELAGLGP